MFSLLACLALGLGAVGATGARAATVDLTLTLAFGTIWTLNGAAAPGTQVGQIALLASSSLGTFTPQSPPVCPPANCIVLGDPFPPPDFSIVHLQGEGPLLFTGGSIPILLGTFAATTGSAAEIQLVGGDALFGYTVVDAFDNVIEDVSIVIVSEPGSAGLLLLAGVLALRRGMGFDAGATSSPACRAWTSTTSGST
jgi:hypothetical protein